MKNPSFKGCACVLSCLLVSSSHSSDSKTDELKYYGYFNGSLSYKLSDMPSQPLDSNLFAFIWKLTFHISHLFDDEGRCFLGNYDAFHLLQRLEELFNVQLPQEIFLSNYSRDFRNVKILDFLKKLPHEYSKSMQTFWETILDFVIEEEKAFYPELTKTERMFSPATEEEILFGTDYEGNSSRIYKKFEEKLNNFIQGKTDKGEEKADNLYESDRVGAYNLAQLLWYICAGSDVVDFDTSQILDFIFWEENGEYEIFAVDSKYKFREKMYQIIKENLEEDDICPEEVVRCSLIRPKRYVSDRRIESCYNFVDHKMEGFAQKARNLNKKEVFRSCQFDSDLDFRSLRFLIRVYVGTMASSPNYATTFKFWNNYQDKQKINKIKEFMPSFFKEMHYSVPKLLSCDDSHVKYEFTDLPVKNRNNLK